MQRNKENGGKDMKLRYPAEAFALGVVLFSSGMKEAFAAGILTIFAVVFAEFLRNLLTDLVPDWSVKLSVYLGTGAVCASAFLAGLTVLGMEVELPLWMMVFLLGLLAARHVLTEEIDAEYGDLFWECAIGWGFWILLAIAREFFATGEIFGNMLIEPVFHSNAFLEPYFGFITAGLVLAFTNGVLKKRCGNVQSLFLVIPLALFMRPFEVESFGEVGGFIWTAIVPVILFISVKRILRFSRTGMAYRGLPTEMLSMGFIYMILSIY